MVRPLPFSPASEVGAASCSLSLCLPQHSPFAFSPLRVCLPSRFSHVLWTAAHQAPSSVRLSRQEHWSRLPCPPPGDVPNPGIKPASPGSSALLGHQGSHQVSNNGTPYFLTPRTPQHPAVPVVQELFTVPEQKLPFHSCYLWRRPSYKSSLTLTFKISSRKPPAPCTIPAQIHKVIHISCL